MTRFAPSPWPISSAMTASTSLAYSSSSMSNPPRSAKVTSTSSIASTTSATENSRSLSHVHDDQRRPVVVRLEPALRAPDGTGWRAAGRRCGRLRDALVSSGTSRIDSTTLRRAAHEPDRVPVPRPRRPPDDRPRLVPLQRLDGFPGTRLVDLRHAADPTSAAPSPGSLVQGPGGIVQSDSVASRLLGPRNRTGLSRDSVAHYAIHSDGSGADDPQERRTAMNGRIGAARLRTWLIDGNRGVERPGGLVTPVRVDPDGVHGPTENQARGPGWRQTSWGRYVPPRGGPDGCRAADRRSGLSDHGRTAPSPGGRPCAGTVRRSSTEQVAVARVSCRFRSWWRKKIRPDPRTQDFRGPARTAPSGPSRAGSRSRPCSERCSTSCVGPTVRARGANAIAMAAAARLISRRLFAMYVAQRNAWTGVPARPEGRGAGQGRVPITPGVPDAAWCWLLDAEFPEPLCNREVYDLDGQAHRNARSLRP